VGIVISENRSAAVNSYDLDPIAEIYDQTETQTDDIAQIRRLIADQWGIRILEPFAGTGRLVIPLAQDGHYVTGLELAGAMLRRAATKIAVLTPDVQSRITLLQADVLRLAWPSDFDLVLLGGNCLYELATPEEQESVIHAAVSALRKGGYLYVDNDHMEGPLDPAWCEPGEKPAFPSGRCVDGTAVHSTVENTWFDRPARLVEFRRRVSIASPDGQVSYHIFCQQKHPVSAVEVRYWLERQGMKVEQAYGDHHGSPYSETSPRAVFWARKTERCSASARDPTLTNLARPLSQRNPNVNCLS
jgi:hypothetical protein